MKRKMYILRTWMWENEDLSVDSKVSRHPTKLSVYIAEPPISPIPNGVPYITTSKLSAKKFYTKKQALKYGRKFGGCYVDVVWHYQKSMKLEVIDLWK